PFHANLLQAAISAGAPVQPAALRFADAATGETSFAPRYIDHDQLAGSDLPFHATLLQAAISAGAPVQPAALRFADAATGETSFAPRYIDDDNLVVSLWSTLCAPPLLAIVCFGDPQPAAGRERRAWAHSLHEDVQALRRATH